MQNFNSKFKIIKKFLTFTVLTLIFNFALLTLHLDKADASVLDLGIYPPIIKVEATPPTNLKIPISIENLGEEQVNLKIQLKPFKASESQNGEIVYYPETKPPSLPDPLIFQRVQILESGSKIETVDLAPQQKKQLEFFLDLPKDEPLTDYYFSIAFISNVQTDEESKKLNLSQASGGIAINVLLSIGPKGEAKGIVDEYSVPLFLEKGPVPFTVKLKNTSEQVITPNGTILIKNVFGQIIGSVDLLPVNILANSTRAIPDSFQSPDATPPANFRLENLRLMPPKAFWYENFLLGPYTADLTLSLSDKGPILRRTIYFFAFPLQAIIGVIIAILIILLIRSRLKSR